MNIVKIESINHITHDVLQIVVEKPEGFVFTPGQATDISINKPGWNTKKNSFTFTCLPGDNYLEFTIKTYPSHKRVTNELLLLRKNDELIIHDVFGTITYKQEGLFIAGGAGVTPFISIFRYLHSKNKTGNNKLIFANKTKNDIILRKELEDILGKNFINILSDEQTDDYEYGLITEAFLKLHLNNSVKNIYLCGPPPMMKSIEKQLADLKIDKSSIIKEVF